MSEGTMNQNYIGRKINGIRDMDVLSNAHKREYNVLLQGPTGSAKTMVAQQYAKQYNYDLVVVPCSVSTEPSQLFGRYIPKEDSDGFVWNDGVITELLRKMDNGESDGGVLVLDEINMADPRVAASLYSMMDRNRVLHLIDRKEDIPNGNLLIIGTMNPGYRGTRDLNKALSNRFNYIINWGYDDSVENRISHSPSLLKVISELRSGMQQGEFQSPFSTNMLIEFHDNYNDFGFDFAVSMAANKYREEERDSVVKIFEVRKSSIINEFQNYKKPTNVKDMSNEFKNKKLFDFGWKGIDD